MAPHNRLHLFEFSLLPLLRDALQAFFPSILSEGPEDTKSETMSGESIETLRAMGYMQ